MGKRTKEKMMEKRLHGLYHLERKLPVVLVSESRKQ
jgi:hypothetical protein